MHEAGHAAAGVLVGRRFQGFVVEKRPGHGRKRERLEAHLSSVFEPSPPPRVAAGPARVLPPATTRIAPQPSLPAAPPPSPRRRGNARWYWFGGFVTLLAVALVVVALVVALGGAALIAAGFSL